MTKKGCCLWWVMVAVLALIVWARISLPLEEFGTVTHVGSDGETHENPIAVFTMIGIVAVMIVVTSVMLTRAEKKVIEAGDVAESQGGDPLPGVTKTAKAGCGTGLAMLAVLFVCSLLGWIFSMVGGL